MCFRSKNCVWEYLKAKHRTPRYGVDHEREKVEELYDLGEDIGEPQNVAREFPELTKRLMALLK